MPNGIKKYVGGYLAKYNSEELGVFETIEKAYEIYSRKKKEAVVEIANEYKNIIPVHVYNALLAYEFDMENDRNYMLVA